MRLKEVFMSYFEGLIKSDVLKKFLALLILVAVFYLFREMINLILLTFIFAYVFYSAQDNIYRRINKHFKISRNIVIFGVYLLLVLLIVFVCVRYIPIITKQLMDITNELSVLDTNAFKNKIDPRILELIQGINFKDYIKQAGTNIIETMTNIGKVGINIFLAFIMSLFFVLEKEELRKFGLRLEKSRAAFFYNYYKYFTRHFVESFGNVIKMQFLVAFINGVLSTIMLAIIGMPQVLGLGFMVFVFGLIPVAGVIITLIPLIIIAFSTGGIIKVIYILAMIAVLHALESYVLNPKLMSATTKLPVFITFAILIVSEHLMGIWGLLIGIPLFMFILNVVGAGDGSKHKDVNKVNLKI